MTLLINRRRFGCCCAGALIPPSVPQQAPKKPALDGAWRAGEYGASAEVTVSSDAGVGFFWGYHYFDPINMRFSDKGERLDFVFNGGRATLTRTGARTALLVVEEGRVSSRMKMTKE
jgi:hypothetical protein